jgi:hypothetical protein
MSTFEERFYTLFGDLGIPAEEVKKKVVEQYQAKRQEEEAAPGFFTENFIAWHFDSENLVLIHKETKYGIPIAEISSSAAILDWIMQVFNKEWSDPLDIYTLLVALQHILQPQANYCPFEEDRRTDGRILAEHYAEQAEKHREETERLEKIRDVSIAILSVLEYNKPMPLSLLVESIDYARDDIIEMLGKLESVNVITIDRESRYITLICDTSDAASELQ